jgi:hypothetical protein
MVSALATGAITTRAEMPPPAQDAGWREPLGRAEALLAGGEARRAERAWEEARRAAMRSRMPPGGLIDVGLAYIRIGQAAHDHQMAVSRARQLLLRALFRARERRDVDGMTAAGQAFATLGDCKVAERVYTLVLTMAPQRRGQLPACERIDASRQPSASPRQDAPPDARPPQAR